MAEMSRKIEKNIKLAKNSGRKLKLAQMQKEPVCPFKQKEAQISTKLNLDEKDLMKKNSLKSRKHLKAVHSFKLAERS